MCCLFGVLNYGGHNPEIDNIINQLAQEATIRGVDSTGIAYNKHGKLRVYKRPLSAYEMDFKGLDDCIVVTGHTRHATQGSKDNNYNNHPFPGRIGRTNFALCHNGVLWNDKTLRSTRKLPKTKIETDSYIAVQLIEQYNKFGFSALRKMAESVHGSFTFTLTDNADNLWIVKGDNPLTLVHFPELKLYVYASTNEIVFAGMCHSELVNHIEAGDFEVIRISSGEIVKIDKHGEIETQYFDYDTYGGYGYDWKTWNNTPVAESDFDYLEELKTVAKMQGIPEDDIQWLIDSGYSYDEIEDYIYYG